MEANDLKIWKNDNCIAWTVRLFGTHENLLNISVLCLWAIIRCSDDDRVILTGPNFNSPKLTIILKGQTDASFAFCSQFFEVHMSICLQVFKLDRRNAL